MNNNIDPVNASHALNGKNRNLNPHPPMENKCCITSEHKKKPIWFSLQAHYCSKRFF